jgi:hypothetical protein
MLAKMKADRKFDQAKADADREQLLVRMEAKMDANQAGISVRMDTNLNEMRKEILSGQAEMRSQSVHSVRS